MSQATGCERSVKPSPLTFAYLLDALLGLSFLVQSIGILASIVNRGADVTLKEFLGNLTTWS